MRNITSGLLIFIGLIFCGFTAHSQYSRVAMDREYILSLTSQWKGDRLPDGRPFVPDNHTRPNNAQLKINPDIRTMISVWS